MNQSGLTVLALANGAEQLFSSTPGNVCHTKVSICHKCHFVWMPYVNEIVLQASTHMGRRNCTISNNSVAYCSILVGPVLSDAVMYQAK